MPEEAAPARRKRRLARNALIGIILVLVLVVGAAWLQRESLADRLISDVLNENGIQASYSVESIGTRRQVLTDVVLGDPQRPDLTVDRIELSITPRFGLPALGALFLERPRLYGTLNDGKLSFGSLDPLIFTGGDEPFEFPDLELTVRDGRGLLEGDYGPVGFKIDGSGHLRGGFSGIAAASAPRLLLPGCVARKASLYGRISINAERPRFAGPLRFDALDCGQTDLAIAGGAIMLDLQVDRDLAGLDGGGELRLATVQQGNNRVAAVEGQTEYSFRDGNLTARYEAQARALETGAVRMALLEIDGSLRTGDALARIEIEADLSGRNVQIGRDLDQALASAQASGEETLLAPLLGRLRGAIAAESRNSTLEANLRARRESGHLSLVVPEARLRGASGASLLALSRGQFAIPADGRIIFSGAVASGGKGLPRIAARMDREAGGTLDLRLSMQEYSAGSARLAFPSLRLRQMQDGAWDMQGRVLASGPLPGGFAENLQVPVSGRIATDGTLALWKECVEVRFDRLAVSNLAFGRQALTLCPPANSSIVRRDSSGLRIAAGATSLQLAGRLGETPIRIASGPIGFAWPGAVSARELDISLGPSGTATRFAVADLSAKLGNEVGGRFAGADIFLDAVPLDLMQASGAWRYADGRLSLDDGQFALEDRQADARFEPLVARDAALTLVDNLITAVFTLRNPQSDREVTKVRLSHNLDSAIGHADLDVANLRFDDALQPRDLTRSLYGVVSLVDGTITGSGRIDWNVDSISSSGRFSSRLLDLAAAFGPVAGASGTVEFTDLLGLTTAPGQRIFVQSVNPGIEVFDGEILFSLDRGELLNVENASWPFLGGRLSMAPVTLKLGVEEEQRYVFMIDGLEASRFVERMEMANFAATGIFDGEVPIIFDAEGNGRLEGGFIVSRPPGGHVSYVGDLTYEDLSYIGNLAFQTLRDLRYDQMEIGMNGPLTGELVTRVRFEGIKQGEGAKTNFITRRIANLPIELRVNVRAPFYQLIRTMRSLYDPASVRDPRGLGLLGSDGSVIQSVTDQNAVDARDAALEAEQNETQDIQAPESEALP